MDINTGCSEPSWKYEPPQRVSSKKKMKMLGGCWDNCSTLQCQGQLSCEFKLRLKHRALTFSRLILYVSWETLGIFSLALSIVLQTTEQNWKRKLSHLLIPRCGMHLAPLSSIHIPDTHSAQHCLYAENHDLLVSIYLV